MLWDVRVFTALNDMELYQDSVQVCRKPNPNGGLEGLLNAGWEPFCAAPFIDGGAVRGTIFYLRKAK